MISRTVAGSHNRPTKTSGTDHGVDAGARCCPGPVLSDIDLPLTAIERGDRCFDRDPDLTGRVRRDSRNGVDRRVPNQQQCSA
jgi:hypothetical protein